MNQRYKGPAPVTFLTLPAGEVHPGDVLTGASADAVAGRSDFEEVAEVRPADASDAPADIATGVDAASSSKARKATLPKDADSRP